MGAQALFCCFKHRDPGCISFVAITANIISFGFMIWSLLDLNFIKKGVKVLYIFSFVLLCICLASFIAVFLFFIIPRFRSSRALNNLGRILCLLIIAFCVLGFVLLLIGFIIDLVKYAKLERDFEYGKYWNSREWATLFVPAILAFISYVIMALCANVLYSKFDELISPIPMMVNVNQNSMSTFPNVQQPGIFPNNSGLSPNINFQESGTDIKN